MFNVGEEKGEKMEKVKIEQNVFLHNEATIEVRNVETEEVKTYKAYNVILDQAWPKIVGCVAIPSAVYQRGMYYASNLTGGFGPYIQMGTGTAAPHPANTQLAGHVYKTGVSYETSMDIATGIAYYTQYAVWDVGDDNGPFFGEVALSTGTGATDISTRALIKDDLGNPITIEKTPTVTITIYYKTYCALQAMAYGANVDWVAGGVTDNMLLRLFSNTYTRFHGNGFQWKVGSNNTAITKATDREVLTEIGNKWYAGPTASIASPWTVTFTELLSTTECNGTIWELGLLRDDYYCQTPNSRYPLFRAVMPVAGIFDNHTITDDDCGTGDGVEDEFNITWFPIETLTNVKVDGNIQTNGGVDYTANLTTGLITFEVGSIPPLDDEVTSTYDVEFIPKDASRILDIEFVLGFASA